MTGRLVYEVRLRKTEANKRSSRWRWDVSYLKTTDPEYPGVETGRKEISHDWGYEKYKWQATRKISKRLLTNKFQKDYKEV